MHGRTLGEGDRERRQAQHRFSFLLFPLRDLDDPMLLNFRGGEERTKRRRNNNDDWRWVRETFQAGLFRGEKAFVLLFPFNFCGGGGMLPPPLLRRS